MGEDCKFCKRNVKKQVEYNYYVNLNESDGIINVKPSVFFSMNAIEKASKKSKRDISWLVIKTGSGLDTEYTVSKNENLEEALSEKELEANNEKLANLMKQKEATLKENYEKVDSGELNGKEEVDPEDIPF